MAKSKGVAVRKTKTVFPGYSPYEAKRISQRAYFIWVNKGRPPNTAFDDWLQAERELG